MPTGHEPGQSVILERTQENFLVLVTAYLDTAGDQFYFLHVSRSHSDPNAGPDHVLGTMGLRHYQGRCPYLSRSCHWIHLGTAAALSGATRSRGTVRPDQVRSQVETFVAALPTFWKARQHEHNTLEKVHTDLGLSGPSLFRAPLAIEPLDAETPPDWLDEVKFSRLLQLEVEERKIATEISDLVVYPRLLYAQGEILEAAVAASLRRIGLHDVEPQRRGSPIDIRASTPSGAKLGFEVTGSISCIRKGDRKVGQLLAFDFSEGDETKPILVANTQRNLRIADREGPFSDWVRDYFASHHRVLLMTGWDLYRLVRDVFESRRTSAQAIQVLDATTGILDLK